MKKTGRQPAPLDAPSAYCDRKTEDERDAARSLGLSHQRVLQRTQEEGNR
jgi:hypothetical protein